MNNWKEIQENAIFVGGHRKNGTTLLISLLDGHPDIFVYPYETHFWYSLYPLYFEDNFSFEDRKNRVLDYIFGSLKLTIKKWLRLRENDLNFSYEKLNEMFNQKINKSERSIKDFLDAIIFCSREILPDPNYKTHKMWLEKCTGSEIFANIIFRFYKKAKYIHVIRDPRDNWSVIKQGWDKHYHTQYDSKERLLRSVIDRNFISQKMAIDNPKLFGYNRYLVIKYENLVQNPSSVIKKVCKFLDLSFSAIKLYPSFCEIPWKGNSLSNITYNSISKSRVEIYKKLPAYEIKILEYYFSDMMIKLGYKPCYKNIVCAEAAREHYKWFNSNQTYSLKPIRKNYSHLNK